MTIAAIVRLPGEVTAELLVDCKADPRPSQFPYVNILTEFGERGERETRIPVFAAPYISPNMAKICWDHGWSWFDLAGNCRLSVPRALYLERTGQERVDEHSRPSANLSTPEAARVIRILLAPFESGYRWTGKELARHSGLAKGRWTQRELREKANTSIGLVNKIVRHLRDEAYIENNVHGGFRLRDPMGLLAAWHSSYRFDRHQRRDYFTLLRGKELQEGLAKLSVLTGGHAAYAAFSAADFQAPHVRQPKTWLFIGAEYEDKFREITDAKLVDSGGNLVLLIPDDDGVFHGQENLSRGESRLPCTNPVQTYVDLCNCGSRGEDAAEALLEQCLKRGWKERGLKV